MMHWSLTRSSSSSIMLPLIGLMLYICCGNLLRDAEEQLEQHQQQGMSRSRESCSSSKVVRGAFGS